MIDSGLSRSGRNPERVQVTGNIKFDQPLRSVQPDESQRRSLGLNEHEQLILTGSTHAGEEELLVSAYETIAKSFPSMVSCSLLAISSEPIS